LKLRRGGWFIVSAALHALVVVLLLQAILSPRSFFRPNTPPQRFVPENITYVIPAADPPAAAPRLETPPPAISRPPVRDMPSAPVIIPPTLPPPDSGGGVVDIGVRGAATPPGAIGPPAVQPDFSNSAIFGGPPALHRGIVEPPARTGLAGIQYDLDSAYRRLVDSASKVGDPTDWTVGEGKGKVGLDSKWIYLGPVKLPSMLLALIPLNVQANPNLRENQRTLGAMASEIRERGGRDASAGAEIKAITARMNAERAARRAIIAKTIPPASGSVPPPR
jgi:hypothetical protein